MSLGLPSVPRFLRPLALVSLALLASCGGGDRVSNFAPQRLFVFGDESNVIVGAGGSVTDVDGNVITAQAGAKYSINALALDPAGALDCAANALWTQYVAARYGFVFAECNPNAAAVSGFNFAQVGARVANLATQVAAANAARGAFSNTDLVTVMVGQRDILTAYQAATSLADCNFVSGSGGASGAVAQTARALGSALGTQVNAIANAGGRVLIATVPNQGTTPFAAAQNTSPGGFDRASCLSNLTNAFNAGLRSTIINDGRLIGLVQADEQLLLVANNGAIFGYVSTNTAACQSTALPPACSTTTLVSGATVTNYLWVDDRHFGVDAHARIGNLAVTRANNNPF
jgi:phospholipase/lecithinase/hemolysin